MTRGSRLAAGSLALAALLGQASFGAGGCSSARDDAAPPSHRRDVGPILGARCARCHAGPAPAGGWRADSFRGAIGCTASGAAAATTAPDAPILAALARADHAGFVSDEERETLARWLAAGAPSVGQGVHRASFADPRSPLGHAALLRAGRYRPMLDPRDPDACGRCHEGGGARPPEVTLFAPGASACATCHVEEGGPFACTTCHGSAGKPYPPRDPCFFADDPKDRAHAAHAARSASRADGLPCTTCHPTPALADLSSTHANGWVEVWFDYRVAGNQASFEAEAKRCAGTCHARGGARPTPSWTDGPVGCGDCHGSPPAGHYAGACTSCHREADAKGTALVGARLHVNGKVDLGDGSGACGACHGKGDDPWPETGAHAAHAQPKSAPQVACETCHDVPAPGAAHPVGRGAAAVRLAGLARKGGRRASYDAATKTCAGTYCHEGNGASAPAPRWTDGAAVSACSGCHGAPPPPPHSTSAACGTASCHDGLTTTSGLAVTPAGRLVHLNGFIDLRAP